MLQQTPRDVTAAPPSVVIFPLQVNEFSVMEETLVVETVERIAGVVAVT